MNNANAGFPKSPKPAFDAPIKYPDLSCFLDEFEALRPEKTSNPFRDLTRWVNARKPGVLRISASSQGGV
jgi:hypothetical protein